MTELLPTPPATLIDAFDPDVQPTWSPPFVAAALLEHESGDFALSSLLADALRRDDRCFTSLDSRVLGLLGLPFAIDESDEAPTKALKKASQKLARQIRGWWHRCLPEATLADFGNAAITLGFSVGEMAWARGEDGFVYPRIVVHHGQHVRRNPTTKQLELLTTKGPIVITPGDGRWILFAPAGAARPWMGGAVRALAVPFLIRQFTRRDWADRSEIEGTGIRKAKGPVAIDDKRFKDFVSQIRKMGRKSVIAFQDGWDFNIAVTDANAAILFEKLVAHADTAITLTILGQNLTTQIEGGSHAAASVHARVLRDRLESDVAMLSTVVRDQVLLPWCLYNIPGFDRRLLPWPRWDTTPPEDIGKKATAYVAIGQAIAGLRKEGIDITPLLELFGLELDEEAQKENDAARDPNAKPLDEDKDPEEGDGVSGRAARVRASRGRRRRR